MSCAEQQDLAGRPRSDVPARIVVVMLKRMAQTWCGDPYTSPGDVPIERIQFVTDLFQIAGY